MILRRVAVALVLVIAPGSAGAQPAPPPPPPTTPPTTPAPTPTPPDAPAPSPTDDATTTTTTTTEPAEGEEPDEDLLAHIHDDDDAAKPTGDTDEGATFGKQLKIFGVETTWSGYGDSSFTIIPKERESTFDAIQFNPIFSARITDDFSAEMELELEHGGLETELEYAMVDWTPLHTGELVVRAGKFQIPIGKFNEQFHPSFRWPQISRPLMFQEVVPVGLSDIGLQLRGTIGRTTQLEYQVWVVNGFAEKEEGAAVEEEEEEEEGGIVAGWKDNFIDNNFDKTVGARVGLNINTPAVSATVAVSGQSGKVDDAGAERLSIADVDASFAAGPVSLHVEAAQSFFGRKHHYLDRFERGIYAQLAVTFGKWTAAGRWDYTKQVEIEELPDGTEELEHPERQLAAVSLRYAVTRQWSVRLEVAVPFKPKGATDETAIAAMIAFVF